jgi:serine/threonine protein kinase
LSITGAIESVRPGQAFGRYVVEAPLARGGMGEVWLASALGPGGFKKRVVIKTILPGLLDKPGYVEMLVKEASLAARLNHPNVVQVFDLGCIGGLYYIAMEYLSGRSLAQMLRRANQMSERLSIPVLISMFAATCDGLAYAHAQTDDDGAPLGILHRDISPSNLMLTFTGRVAILDFGVATASRGRFQTRSGQIKGKFHYLAPERVRGEVHDRRSDIYSLGVVLYQCLTLRWPFRAKGDYELLRQIANEEAPPPAVHVAGLPAELERIVMRAMAREPADRYPDAQQMATDLRAFAQTSSGAPDASELAAYLARLFPDGADIARRSDANPRPIGPVSMEDDDIEIVFAGEVTDPSASDTARESTPPRPPGAVGSASTPPAEIAGTRDIDIFPEPTRTLTRVGAGSDVFGGYARTGGRRRTRSGPAFFGVRLGSLAGDREDAGK